MIITDTATSTQGLFAIRCCGRCLVKELSHYRIKLVQEIWELLLSIGVHLDISHFNALLLVYLENEYSFNPLRFLASIVELDIEPNKVFIALYLYGNNYYSCLNLFIGNISTSCVSLLLKRRFEWSC